MNTIIFPCGPFAISVFSLSFSVGIIAGLSMLISAGWKEGLQFQRIIDFILISLVCGLVGGRIAYILTVNRGFHFQQMEQVIRLQDGGISFWGGFILALAVAAVWAGRRNFPLGPFLDAAAPALALGLSIGRIGYPWQGKTMCYPFHWGIVKGEQTIHPEGAYAIVLLMLLYFYLVRRRRLVHYKGELMLLFIVGYALINLMVDHFSSLPVVAWGWATAGQLVSMFMIILAIIYIIGGSKIYSSSYYYECKIYPPLPSRSKLSFKILWAILVIAGQIYLYFMVNGFPEELTNLIQL